MFRLREDYQQVALEARLSKEHYRELAHDSGIEDSIIYERDYRTVTAAEARQAGFARSQARDGLLIPFYTPDGEVSYQLKPRRPRRDKRGRHIKYDTRAGHDIVVDVLPSNNARLLHPDQNGEYEPFYIVEGIKKADAAASRGKLVVGLSGTWNWGKKRKHGGVKYGRPELLPDWDAIQLEGRKVYIPYDRDYKEKQGVADALLRLAERLTERGAHVYIMDLPGPEKGLDDYLVASGSLEALEAAARPFTASNLIRYAAKPDKRIRRIVDSLYRKLEGDDFQGAATTHSLVRAILELALLRGRYGVSSRAVEVVIGTRELQHFAGIGSRNTLSSHTNKAIERGYFEKVPGERKKGKANRYILKFSKSVPLIERDREVILEGCLDCSPGTDLENFAPHLRWASPTSATIPGDERDSQLPRERVPVIPRDDASSGLQAQLASGGTWDAEVQYITPPTVNDLDEKPVLSSIHQPDAPRSVPSGRHELEMALGKVVEMCLHLLLSRSGASTLPELAQATGVKDTSKLRKKLEGVQGVFGMEAKGKHGACVWLEDGWQRSLDERRERAGEIRRARAQAKRNREARLAFHDLRRLVPRRDEIHAETAPDEAAAHVRAPLPTGREIVESWAEYPISDEHPLVCDCLDCTTAAPRYARARSRSGMRV